MENSKKDKSTRPPDLSPEKPVCKFKKQQLEPDMEQLTSSKLGKEYNKAVYCHNIVYTILTILYIVCITYMQSTPCEMPGWMKHKLESRFLREISITSDKQMTSPL